MSSGTILTLDKPAKKITIDLGDDGDRARVLQMVEVAFDMLEGKRKSVVDIERIALMRYMVKAPSA